jgi:hypothetical protein
MDHQLEIKCVYVCVCVCVRCVCRRHRPTESSFGNKVGRVRFLQQPFFSFPRSILPTSVLSAELHAFLRARSRSAVVRVK